MKIYIILIIILVFAANCNSDKEIDKKFQTKINIGLKHQGLNQYIYVDSTGYYASRDFDGIGQYKVGRSTISLMDELKIRLKTNISKVDNSSDEYFFDNHIIELLPNNKESYNNPSKYSYCPEVRIFKIEKNEISTVILDRIYLTFYRDTLIEFECRDDEKIGEALSFKYGNGIPITREFNFRCGDRMKSDGKIKIQLWHNERIQAELRVASFFCMEKQYESYFKMRVKSDVFESIARCDSINETFLVEKRKNEAKSKMKEF